jgi:hypothetical protein
MKTKEEIINWANTLNVEDKTQYKKIILNLKWNGDCLEWTKCKENSYPRFWFNKKPTSLHRLFFEFAFGPIEPGLVVCHKCDNKKCINPNHLFKGTTSDNNWDRSKKGRNGDIRGELHPLSKLNSKEIRAILNLKGLTTQQKVANKFNVNRSTIGKIWRGERWKHILVEE